MSTEFRRYGTSPELFYFHTSELPSELTLNFAAFQLTSLTEFRGIVQNSEFPRPGPFHVIMSVSISIPKSYVHVSMLSMLSTCPCYPCCQRVRVRFHVHVYVKMDTTVTLRTQ